MSNNAVFTVPNDYVGRFFITLCRRYAKKGIRIRCFGRHPQRKKAVERKGLKLNMHGDVPLDLAKTMEVYMATSVGQRGVTIFGPQNTKHRWDLEGKVRRIQNILAE